MDYTGTIHGACNTGLKAAEECRMRVLEKHGDLDDTTTEDESASVSVCSSHACDLLLLIFPQLNKVKGSLPCANRNHLYFLFFFFLKCMEWVVASLQPLADGRKRL